MGSGDWIKTIITRKKKAKQDGAKKLTGSSNQQSKGFELKSQSRKDPGKLFDGADGMASEDIAATRIQTAFRGFKARKAFRSLKRVQRLQAFTHRNSVQKQATNTWSHVQSWSKMQAAIRARRAAMVAEGRFRQKKHDNRSKLDAKLHDPELEWNGGSETKEEIVARIQQREEAAVKRERAMAYAFSHQWRVMNSGVNQGPFVYELAKGNWEWSWVDKWIAARPWETRLSAHSMAKTASKAGKNTSLSDQKAQGSTKKPSEAAAASKESKTKVASSARPRTKSTKATKQEQQP
ncbi:hypothetical protein OPV22_020361 [Ensete ventricosum]|uniref:Uncharacterized protein n=1 Tax=Ensete ventricosum TaxID=4639 RepID=A0AAV8QPM5_ENSVE|nr:hypothetical protein OPV22_020361 [Ensete ventricosum]